MERIAGIYVIRNDDTDTEYIGSSVNIYLRWRKHREGLNRGNHPNPILQNYWNKYGEKSFLFDVLEVTKELKERELYWINQRKPKLNCIVVTERKNPDELGFCFSEDMRKKLSTSHLGNEPGNKGKHPSDETRKKLSVAHLGQPAYWKGKHIPEEAKQKIADYNRGKKHTEEHKRKTSESLKGRYFPPELKEKISEGLRRSWAKRKNIDAINTNI